MLEARVFKRFGNDAYGVCRLIVGAASDVLGRILTPYTYFQHVQNRIRFLCAVCILLLQVGIAAACVETDIRGLGTHPLNAVSYFQVSS
jgi:hypothetical protein